MKRRTLTLTLSILVCVALIGVGFASWVITHEDTNTQTGNITVDTVEDKTHTIKVLETGKDLAVYFGAPKDMNTTGAWLTNDTANTEDLVATFQIEVTNYSTANVAVAATDGFVVNKKDTTKANLDDYKTLFTYKVEIGAFTAKEGETTTGVATVKITFSWGSDFKPADADAPVNPYNYYNGLEFSTTNANNAKTKLGKLAELNESTFVLKLVTSTITESQNA